MDSSVLVHLYDAGEPQKQQTAAARLRLERDEGRELVLSTNTLAEVFRAPATPRKGGKEPLLPPEAAQKAVPSLMSRRVVVAIRRPAHEPTGSRRIGRRRRKTRPAAATGPA